MENKQTNKENQENSKKETVLPEHQRYYKANLSECDTGDKTNRLTELYSIY